MSFFDLKIFSRMCQSPVPMKKDQAASQNQGFLWHHRKRCQGPELDRHLCLCARGHREEALKSGPKSLHKSTGFEHDSFRENTYFTGTFKCNLHKSSGPSQQPTEFIQLTLGQ